MQNTIDIAQESLEDTQKIVETTNIRLKDLENINTLANSNARSVEEIASASEHLHLLTEDLNKKINEFKV